MLTISFATRTDSALDPLTERALALAKEFNELAGTFTPFQPFVVRQLTSPMLIRPQVQRQTLSTLSNHSSGSLLQCDPVAVGSMMKLSKSTVP